MYAKLTLIAVTVALVAGGTVSAVAAPKGAFDPITASYSAKTGEYCVRSGWGQLTRHANRLVRAGECRTAAEWRKRGLEFETVAIAS